MVRFTTPYRPLLHMHAVMVCYTCMSDLRSIIVMRRQQSNAKSVWELQKVQGSTGPKAGSENGVNSTSPNPPDVPYVAAGRSGEKLGKKLGLTWI